MIICKPVGSDFCKLVQQAYFIILYIYTYVCKSRCIYLQHCGPSKKSQAEIVKKKYAESCRDTNYSFVDISMNSAVGTCQDQHGPKMFGCTSWSTTGFVFEPMVCECCIVYQTGAWVQWMNPDCQCSSVLSHQVPVLQRYLPSSTSRYPEPLWSPRRLLSFYSFLLVGN